MLKFVLTLQINSNRSAVSCEAIDTVAFLFEHLRADMDRFVDRTGTPLLARFTSLDGLKERATIALEKMICYCDSNKVLYFLVTKGLR